jgi:hypoxanthine phosphoribosyltransferase
MDFEQDFDETLLTVDEFRQMVLDIGDILSKKYRGKDVLLVGVLRGCVVFISDLMREIEFPVEIDFLAVSSYGKTSETSGVVRVLKDLSEDIEGRHVILVEDIPSGYGRLVSTRYRRTAGLLEER